MIDRTKDRPPHHASLLRHFADLRDGTHGGVSRRQDKERLFADAVTLLDPIARAVLVELNDDLLLGSGSVEGSGVTRSPDGGVHALWVLSWPEQRTVDIAPVTIRAHYGRGFHHPHLRGGTVGEWPLNVFDTQQAQEQRPILAAIATAELHNLVFQADYRIVPATVKRVGH